MIRRYILNDEDVLTPEAVRAILAKESLLKASKPVPSTGHLISARGHSCYFVVTYKASDSAEQRIEEDSPRLTMFASEAVLRRDWDTPEEDEAWADL